ncbi:uncharacterized protein CIMG_13328 [Coccidioides immitis RS]|uniref:Uncharacterized protein n=1 Tax=Coccidioides immitis (strain RS) TaxID=246410 RepID=A0A0D8JXD2_COCIM|nr:uncharacterized protein CIMG_13328 [Coccidioides immitis RS]KJF60933.1 hypothetical protein CIMG_13328 [Coccidioides immitis RS]
MEASRCVVTCGMRGGALNGVRDDNQIKAPESKRKAFHMPGDISKRHIGSGCGTAEDAGNNQGYKKSFRSKQNSKIHLEPDVAASKTCKSGSWGKTVPADTLEVGSDEVRLTPTNGRATRASLALGWGRVYGVQELCERVLVAIRLGKITEEVCAIRSQSQAMSDDCAAETSLEPQPAPILACEIFFSWAFSSLHRCDASLAGLRDGHVRSKSPD